jgi:hypothetical protein
MDTKLDWEVDVEGAVGTVDMMDRGEEGGSISRRPCLYPQPRLEACCDTTRRFPNQFPVYIFTAVQRPQPEQPSDIPRLTRTHILQLATVSYTPLSELGDSPKAEQTIWNTHDVMCN